MYNLIEIDKISPNDDTLKRQFVEIFVRDMPKNISLLETYCVKKQFKELAQLSHKMLPTIKMLGNSNLTNSVIRIEEGAQKNNIENLHQLVSTATDDLTEIFNQIKTDFDLEGE